jgi:prophage maintenance system killer protein
MQDTQHYDMKLVACVANCLRRMPANAKPHSPIDTKPDPISDMLEAHFSAHLGDNATAASGTVEFLRTYGGVPRNDIPHPVGGKLLDAHNYFNAIQHFRAVSKSHACDVRKSVSWLRYWHAFLSSHRQELAPGQLKAFPNNVIINNVERTAPGLVQGTLEHIYANYYALLPPCAPRAALAYYIIADIHPFPDGNGRLGRFLMNRELQAAGLRPVVTPANLKPPFGRALNAIRQQFDLRPFVEWLTSCDEYTRGISDELINY